MKNRLIELLNNFYDEYFDICEECDNECEAIAEYLLAHGVIVPSCETEGRIISAGCCGNRNEFSPTSINITMCANYEQIKANF